MNCYGTQPYTTLAPQNGAGMNTGAQFPQTTAPTGVTTTTPSFTGTTFPAETNTSGEWSQPIPVNPNLPTSPVSVQPAEPLPTTLTSPIYTPGYLMRHIGTLMRVEFLIGSSMTDRVGRLREVGASFIILQALDGGSEILCDIYSIKFITLIGNSLDERLYGAFSNT